MPRPHRVDFEGAWHHVMNRGVARTVIFDDDRDRTGFLDELSTASVGHFAIHAYCLMGNHYHLLVQSIDGTLSTAMQRFASQYTHRFNRRHGRDGPLFRGRFLSVGINSTAHLVQALRYIHLNPIMHHPQRQPESWPWSSAAAYDVAARVRGQTHDRGQTHGSDPVARFVDPSWLMTSELLDVFAVQGVASYATFMADGIDAATAQFNAKLQMGSDPWV